MKEALALDTVPRHLGGRDFTEVVEVAFPGGEVQIVESDGTLEEVARQVGRNEVMHLDSCVELR
jgi:hypothetical protein